LPARIVSSLIEKYAAEDHLTCVTEDALKAKPL